MNNADISALRGRARRVQAKRMSTRSRGRGGGRPNPDKYRYYRCACYLHATPCADIFAWFVVFTNGNRAPSSLANSLSLCPPTGHTLVGPSCGFANATRPIHGALIGCRRNAMLSRCFRRGWSFPWKQGTRGGLCRASNARFEELKGRGGRIPRGSPLW